MNEVITDDPISEVAELQAVLDSMWNADREAITAWQAATGRHLTWPDRRALVRWLLDQWQGALGEVTALTKQLQEQNLAWMTMFSHQTEVVAELRISRPPSLPPNPGRAHSLGLVRNWITSVH